MALGDYFWQEPASPLSLSGGWRCASELDDAPRTDHEETLQVAGRGCGRVKSEASTLVGGHSIVPSTLLLNDLIFHVNCCLLAASRICCIIFVLNLYVSATFLRLAPNTVRLERMPIYSLVGDIDSHTPATALPTFIWAVTTCSRSSRIYLSAFAS